MERENARKALVISLTFLSGFIIDFVLHHGFLILALAIAFLGLARSLYNKRHEYLYFSDLVGELTPPYTKRHTLVQRLRIVNLAYGCAVAGVLLLLYFGYWNLAIEKILS
jgi:hypothetical protein